MSVPHRLLVATGNPGKLSELRDLLAPMGREVLSPEDLAWAADISEDGDTLEENALIKAREGVRVTGLATLADDSGLFVDALQGAPGIHSARYAGEDQDPTANCRKLLEALAGVPPEDRGAEFRCVIALVHADGTERLFSGVCRGRILSQARGAGGFGYDPVFEPEGETVTFSQMAASRKNGMSHRGRAMQELCRFLESGESP